MVILRTQGPSCLSVPMLLVILGVCAAALSRLSFRLWRLLAEAREAQPSQGNVCALWEAGIDRSRHRSGGWPSFASGVWWWQRGVGALADALRNVSADAGVREIAAANYLELLGGFVVGVEHTHAFVRDCCLGGWALAWVDDIALLFQPAAS